MEENIEQKPYFTEDMHKTIREMSDEKMFELLLALEQTETWLALVRYNQIRSSYSQSSILSSDPITQATLISRNQGIMLGLADLQNAIIMLRQGKDTEAAEAQKGTDVE